MMDAERLSELFDAHAAPLVLYARQWLDWAAAEDVVQEVFVRLLLQINPPQNAKAWLFTAVRNEAIGHFRSSRRRERRERSHEKPAWFEPAIAEMLDGSLAAEALEALPVGQREVIVLRIWGQMTLKEASEITGLSTSTLFDQYRAGLEALREKLGVPCQKN